MRPSHSRIPLRSKTSALEASNESALPRGFDCPRVVVPAHVPDRVRGRHAVQNGQARERGAGPTTSPAAGHLDALERGPLPQVGEGKSSLGRISR